MLEPSTIAWFALAAPLFPLTVALVLGLALLVWRAPSERVNSGLVSVAFSLSLVCSLVVAAYFLGHGDRPIMVPLGTWFSSADYAFEASLRVDTLSAPIMVLVAFLCGLVGRFSATYLHREPGQPRFYLLMSVFACGMYLLVMAGSLDLLIAGWELVGISSMLLIGFFHRHTFPVRNGLRAFVTYRICDIGLLVGTVLMHHYAHTADFGLAFGMEGFPHGELAFEDEAAAMLIACCLLWAACGKSALFPVGSWLPRAMEGPTPSSAIFYGALSVHAGAYLMLRVHPLLEASPTAQGVVAAVGLLTALHGSMVARVQTDVKSQLAYATTTQIGVIFIEIGVGLPRLALLHIVSHACLRTLQLLRAPNAVADAMLQRAATAVMPEGKEADAVPALSPFRYHLALERFHLDAFWEQTVVQSFLAMAESAESFEQWWVGWIGGRSTPARKRSLSPRKQQG